MASSFFGRLCVLAAALQAAAGHAQVTSITPSPSGSLGTQVDVSYNITGGTRSGTNLFHSFGAFSVGAGDVANFQNDSGLATSNVLGRVTGGVGSDIYGTIRTTDFGSANLFLINPAGWTFGPTATLEVGGSFHASTAHYIRFSDQAQFFADPNQASVLTSAPPVAFGFLGPSASIEIQGSFLQVPEGQTLSLVAESVQIGIDPDFGAPAALVAPSGRVQIGAFTSAGEASIDGLSGSFASLGGVSMVGDAANFLSSTISTSGIADGRVVIRGGQLFMEAGAIVSENFGDVNGAGIDLSLSGSVNLTAGSSVGTAGFGTGRGGDVTVSAPQVSIDGSFVTTSTFGEGRAGDVSFNVGTLALTGGAGVGSSALGNGRAGDVTVLAQQLVSISGRDSLSTPSGLVNLTLTGEAGLLTVSAPALTMFDGGTITSTTFASPLPEDAGGHITVTVDQLSITSGANILSRATGPDRPGGNITVTVNGAAVIAGSDAVGPSGVFSDSCNVCGGAGDITLNARTLALSQGALVQSGGFNEAQGGNVTVSATESIVISDRAGITTQADTLPVGLIAISAPSLLLDNGFIGASTSGPAQAGEISVSVGTLTLVRGGQIASSSEVVATGSGGNVTITADSVSISGTSPNGTPTAPQNTDPSSGIFSTTRGPGNAGQITVTTPALTMADGGIVSVATSGSGAAGNVGLNLGTIALTSGARINSSTTGTGPGGAITLDASSVSIGGPGSGLFSTASNTGNAGQITVSTPTLTLADGAKISASTSGTGNAGTIVANVGSFSLTGGARVEGSTTSAGAGGPITVDAAALSMAGAGSGLFSTASGGGNAGQISVSAPTLTVADGARISVATTSAGNAGTIQANAGNLALTGGARIDSSTTSSGAGGAINLTAASQVSILSGASVTADSLGGAGLAGNITITSGDRIVMTDGSISTRAVTSDGGNIHLNAPNIIKLDNSQITTSVESGIGGGGNISIDPQFLILNNSTITANAFGGPGGNITIVANNFLPSTNSLIQASSALSTPGTIQIESPENNVAGSIAQLAPAFVDASRLLRGLCSARRTGAPSSFVVAGRGGVPVDADGYLPSFSAIGVPVGRAAGPAQRDPGLALAMADPDCMR